MHARRDHTSLNVVLAGLLFAAGTVHLIEANEHRGMSVALGLAFVFCGIIQFVVAGAVAMGPSRFVRAIVVVATSAPAVAYITTRSFGLPGHGREPWDIVGVSTTTAEAVVAVAALAGLAHRIRRRQLVPIVAGLFAIPVYSATAIPPANAPDGCRVPTQNIMMYAEELGNGPDGKPRIGFGFSPKTASTPGPLIEMIEGECAAITLVNNVSVATLRRLRDDGRWPSDLNLPLGISLHPHGVRYTPVSDGTVHTGSFARPGEARTFMWYAAPRLTSGGRVISPGSAGYWWYHDHVSGTDHGTGGLAAGLWGGLIVRRPTDPKPDHTYIVGMGGPTSMINFRQGRAAFGCDANGNKPGPDCFIARQGERVEFLVIGVPGTLSSEDMHVFHLHGHTWADNRTGLLAAPDDDVRVIDAKSVGPSESWGFQVVAGDQSGFGDWMLHCHVQEHSDRGMATFFRVLPPLGQFETVPTLPPITTSQAHGH
jgi:hypothetical protein